MVVQGLPFQWVNNYLCSLFLLLYFILLFFLLFLYSTKQRGEETQKLNLIIFYIYFKNCISVENNKQYFLSYPRFFLIHSPENYHNICVCVFQSRILFKCFIYGNRTFCVKARNLSKSIDDFYYILYNVYAVSWKLVKFFG